jgi:hypothetical protein
LPPEPRFLRWTGYFTGSLHELVAGERLRDIPPGHALDLLRQAAEVTGASDASERYMASDILMNLPNDLLVKMDIASMAHSLEVRSPFLDHQVMEFAAALPPALKLRRLTSKYLLKRVMTGVLPEPILRRTKMGFGVPIDHWFRYELREMAYDVLLDARARGRGYFRPDAVRRRHDRGHRTVRENLDDLLDPGSFVEYGGLAVAAQRGRRSMEELIETTPADGLVTGVGTVNAARFGEDRTRCAVLAYDYTVLAGTQGWVNHHKTDRLLKLAEQHRLPVVVFAEGGGGSGGPKRSLSWVSPTTAGGLGTGVSW